MADPSSVAERQIPARAPAPAPAPTPAMAPRSGPGPARTWLPPVAAVLAGGALFLAYLRLSWTVAANSDGAGNVLQAWDMLHGNLLLHDWALSDTSFYTTELPQYMLIVSALGRHGDVIHVASAMSYTLIVVAAALLAKGHATGREALARMLIAAGIMLAPQLGNGVFVLESSPGHIGTSLPLLATWLVLDRAGRRWWVPPLVGAMLAWVLVADSVTLYAGIAPLVVACGVRAYRKIVMGRQPVSAVWFELSLAVAAVAAIPAASAALAIIRARHGFTTEPLETTLATGPQLPAHASETFEGLLVLFGADFLGMQMGLGLAAALLHLAGLSLAAWATWLGVRGYFRARDPHDLVVAVLTAGVLINVAAYTFSQLDFDPKSSREMTAVLPFAAVLAGRLLAARLTSARLMPALSAVLAGYLVILAYGAAKPALPTENQPTADWLVAHHLSYGIAGYWQAGSLTIASGARTQVRQVQVAHRAMRRDAREFQASWYDPARHYANFIVLGPSKPPTPGLGTVAGMRAIFGPPAHVYHIGPDTVLTYHRNLLADLH